MVKGLNLRRIDFAYIIVIAWLSMFLFKKCSHSHEVEMNLLSLTDSVQSYKDKNGHLIYYNNVISTDFKSLKIYNDSLYSELENMKIRKPSVVIKNVTRFVIDTVSFKITDTLPCSDFVRIIDIDSLYYDINITLTKDSISINKLTIPNEQTMAVGIKNNGLFKKDEYVFAVKNSNPYIISSKIEPYVISRNKKFFERPIVNMFIGAIGATIVLSLTK